MNVIFISMDTLRADRLGCLGYDRGLTPNLDRIAGEGSLFTNAFASDIPTQPSHTAIFTGRFGVTTNIVSHFHPAASLDADFSWLPTIFRDADYATGAVDHLFAMKDWFLRGYTDYMPPPGRSRSPGSVIVDMGTQWLDEHRKEAFFLFLHFWDPHIPYLPPQSYKNLYGGSSALHRDPLISEKLRSRPTYPLFAENLYNHLDVIPSLDYVSDLYDAEVAYLDYEIGRLFDYLQRAGTPRPDHGRPLWRPWGEHDRTRCMVRPRRAVRLGGPRPRDHLGSRNGAGVGSHGADLHDRCETDGARTSSTCPPWTVSTDGRFGR